MIKGSHQSEEAKAKIRAAVAQQKSPLIGRYGITEEFYSQQISEGKRWCRDCKCFLSSENFGKSKRCKECNRKKATNHRKNRGIESHQEYIQRIRTWRNNHPHYKWRKTLQKKYGVTFEWYEEKLSQQDNHCELCSATFETFNRLLGVDHNHLTGKVRGILCWQCNISLDWVESNYLSNLVGPINTEWAQKAKEYLEKYE